MPIIDLSSLPENYAHKMGSEIDAALLDRKTWTSRRKIARNLYYGNAERLDVHWEGSSDIHMPVVYDKVESMVPKLHNAFFNTTPLVVVQRVPEEFDPEETNVQEKWINWALENDVPQFFITTISWFRNMLLDGVGVVKTSWDKKWRNTCEIHNLKAFLKEGEQAQGFTLTQGRPKSSLELLRELFPGGELTRSESLGTGTDASTWEVDLVEGRREIIGIRVEFLKSEFMDEIVARVYRPVLQTDNPRVDIVDAEQLIVPYRTKDLQSADWVAHQYHLRMHDIHARMQDDDDPWQLTADQLERLGAIAHGGGEKYPENIYNETMSILKDQVEGIDGENGKNSISRDNYLLAYEIYTTEDIDHDGQKEEIIVQYLPQIQAIAHVTHLDVVHPHGHRPFSAMHFVSPTDRFYTQGVAEILAPINIQVNTTINQINDAQELQNNPFGFYQPAGMTADHETLQSIPPGTLIPTNDIQSVIFPRWGTQPLANGNVIDSVLLFADRISVSPFSGGNTQVRNAPRTARGTLALISEGNVKSDLLVAMAQREGWREVLFQITGLYRENLTDEKYFWATGRDKKSYAEMIAPRQLKGKFEFTFTGNTTNTNPEVQRTLSQIRYQTGVANPLYQFDMVALRELLRDFYQHFSEGSDITKFLPKLPQSGIESHAPMGQKDELAIMRLGQPIDVLQTDNDAQHIDTLDRFMADGPSTATLSREAVAFIFDHRRRHVAQLQLKQQQAAVQDNNGIGGAEQGVGLGQLEGGVQ